MPGLCMFCQSVPCECTGRKKPGMSRKPLPKKTVKSKPLPEAEPKIKPEVKPKVTGLSRSSALDPGARELIRRLNLHGMLHPDEQTKYADVIRNKPSTGHLNKREEEGGEAANRGSEK